MVGAADGTSRWITGPEARADVHELRATVGAALQLKSTPELQFAEDDVTGGVARVQALLDEMARRDAGTPPPAE